MLTVGEESCVKWFDETQDNAYDSATEHPVEKATNDTEGSVSAGREVIEVGVTAMQEGVGVVVDRIRELGFEIVYGVREQTGCFVGFARSSGFPFFAFALDPIAGDGGQIWFGGVVVVAVIVGIWRW